jgi:ABC-type uncharacterized transport system involved in gliding motility auxiliary subunit
VANRFLLGIAWVATLLTALVVGRFAAIDPRWDAYLVWVAAAAVCAGLVAGLSAIRYRPGRQTITAAFVVAIAVALIVVAGKYATRHDVTPHRVYELAPETRTTLRALNAPARVILFAGQEDFPAYRDLLKEYSAASSFVTIEYVDIETQPMLVKQYGIQQYGTLIIEYQDRIERIRGASEQEFTNAVARLREGRTRKVYFTTGHAERDIDSTERVGYSSVVQELDHDNFVIGTLNFTEQSEVPDDATLVIVAGPRADFFSAEIAALKRYLDAGGAILFLVDPYQDLKRYITETGTALFMIDPSSASATGELRNLTAFLSAQGAELENDVIVENGDMGQFLDTDASVPVVARYPAHDITSGLTSLSAYPMSRSIKPVAVAGKKVAPIIETGDKTWSEANIQELGAGRPSMDPAKGDRPGPLPIGVAISAPPTAPRFDKDAPFRETRLVVVGDSDFVANYSANVPGNSAMFLSIVRWLAQDKPVIIAARQPDERLLTMNATGKRAVSWLALVVLPGIAVGLALYVRRRRTSEM